MNDEFLKHYFRSPRQAFSQSLWRRLQPDERKEPQKMNFRPIRWLYAGIPILICTLVLAPVVSPGVRAQVLTFLREVGQVSFSETTDYPGDDEPVTVIPGEKMSLEQAQQALPFALRLPAWVPDGFQREPEVVITRFSSGLSTAMVMWRKEPGQSLSLSLDDPSPRGKMTWVVGENSVEEVRVNDQPAVLVRGIWNGQEKRWENLEHLSLYWTVEEVTYCLQAQSDVISLPDLLQVANSVR